MMLYCLTSFGGMQQFFRDSDSGWHIRNGERILRMKEVPVSEPFSFSKPGGAWFAWEWLADVCMAGAHGWDGLRGVFFLYLGVLALLSWFWFQLHWAVGSWFLPAALSTWALVTTSTIHWLARPHLFGWLFLLLTVLLAETAAQRRSWRWAAWVFLLGCLWANMHGSFFLGPVIFALYAACCWRVDGPTGRCLGLWAVLALLASFVNPYGWHVHAHIFRYLNDRDLLSKVGEFQTFNFQVEGAAALIVTMLLTGMGAGWNLAQRRWARGVLCALLFVLALRSARALPLAALVGIPLSISAMCQTLAPLRGFAQYNFNLRRLDASCGGLAWTPLLLLAFLALGRLPALAAQAGFSPREFPVALSARIAELPAEARLYSSDKFGGYLIYRFAGQRKVFFDGRSDYYGADFMNRYLKIPAAKPGWREEWDRWQFTHALVPPNEALALWLPALGWTKIGEDQAALLFAKGSN